jgi:hypothetical protein
MIAGTRTLPVILLMTGLLTLSGMAGAIVPNESEDDLESLAFVSERLEASAEPESLDDVRVTAAAGIASTWDSFRVEHGDWSAVVDQRTGKIEIAEGEGIPFVPGPGNQLEISDLAAALGDKQDVDLATMETLTRAFLPRVAGLLGVDPGTLILNRDRSGHPADYLWFVDFDVIREGMVVEDARVVFRVNNGNLIQFGSENLPAEGARVPKAKLTRNQALAILADYVGGFGAADSFLDGGSQRLVPVALADSRFADGFEPGKGRGLARIWQFVFRRDGDDGTWRARIDAANGRLLELRDIDDYAQATGGVKIQGESMPLPMPFTNLSSGGFTNSAGVYNYSGGSVTSTLDGRYVRIVDSCGPISQSSDAGGNLPFDTSGGADCTTPGHGGAGNTHASRTQFYFLNRAREMARAWLPGNAWLSGKLTANVNLPKSCSASWNGSTVNFSRSGPKCANPGEIEAVALHEYGHGLDANDGNGSSPDKGTGETYGDWTAVLSTHVSCIGDGYLVNSTCGGYGDPCTSCTGVRDIDWAEHVSGAPHTAGNFIQTRCPASSSYRGPCGKEGHCESYVSSEALWDLATRDLPDPDSGSSWVTMDRLWYLSRSTATKAFTCVKTKSPWTSNGCSTGSLWKTLRAVDDDDGNLANGTPNSAALFDAFNRHGVACATDPGAKVDFRGCAQPTAPAVSLAAGNHQVTVSWSGSSGVYDVYRSELGCNASFTKIANNVTSSPFKDNNAADDFTYYYQVVAQPAGNESCASAPSFCAAIAPGACTPPAGISGLTAVAAGSDRINLSWTASPEATEYHVYRAAATDGPYALAGTTTGTTFTQDGLSCNTTYFYAVRAARSATCESESSPQVAAATTHACSYSLTVSKNGKGTVTSTPAGINCGSDCSETYPYNTVVTLEASPSSGAPFSGWSGACTGTDSCTVTMTQTQAVTATFSSTPTYTLEVSKNGTGTGTVTSTPGGINCGNDCNERYSYSTTVTLTAAPEPGSTFSGWSGACSGTGSCTVTMLESQAVTATFSAGTYTLTVTKSGNGTVTSSPDGINCDNDCSEAYSYNTLVTLTATPDAGSTFSGWGGACSGTGSCIVTMTQAQAVAATFSTPTTYALIVSKSGTGTCTVTSSPAGINCGADCSELYSHNTSVVLTAATATGSTFDGWSGACSGTSPSCTLTMNQAQAVTATCSPVNYTLTVSKAGTGTGTVTSSLGINCGADCSEPYSAGTVVILTAVPAAGSVFSGWSGACSGTGLCTVTMTQAQAVTATFSAGNYTLTITKAGNGTVTSSPAGINCGNDCSEAYSYNTLVTLTATPDTGSTFSGWGGACSGTGLCIVTMTQAQTVTATFSTPTTYALIVSKSGTGSCTVTSSPAGINCGTDCSELYSHNTSVVLTAAPATGSTFDGWGGACSGTSPSCALTMNQAQAVTATCSPVNYTLTVSTAGTGTGMVTSSPDGINCGNDCNEAYSYNTPVALTPIPAAGSTFSGWSGACSGTGPCTVTMAQAQAVTATFSAATYTLMVTKAGNGTVTSSPTGIDCGNDCSEPYSYNTPVTLTATPAAGSTFSGWSGPCSGTDPCSVTMNQAQTVTATFSSTPTYLLVVSISGAGTVTSSPTGINCGNDCSEPYSYNTPVTLTATPAAGSTFSGWSGPCSGTGPCSVTMNQAQTVTATFSSTPTYLLVVSISGAGTVTSSPAGINCGNDCSEPYSYNTPVTLTATPAAGSTFSGWSGPCSGTGSCTVTMNQAQTVTATFSTVTYLLTVSRAGNGTVTSSPAGINCGNDCNEPYTYNTLVVLTATPGAGSTFSGWGGACSGTGACTVTMNQARAVAATFSTANYILTVSKAGAGTVTSSPAGINCGTDCSESYSSGTTVTLTAAPAAGSVFSGWSGACTGTSSSCTVTVNQAKTVTATFLVPKVTITGPTTITFLKADPSCKTATWSSTITNLPSPYTYKWYKGSQLVGTSATYSECVVKPALGGDYSFKLDLTVTGSNGAKASDPDGHVVWAERDPLECPNCNCIDATQPCP